MKQFIQVGDEHTTPTDIVRIVADGRQEVLPVFSYLISQPQDAPTANPSTVETRYMLQVSTPNRNLGRFSPQPLDAISLAQMLALLSDKGYSADAIVSTVTYYEGKIEALMSGKEPTTAFTRPPTGTKWQPALAREIQDCLKLPKTDNARTRIGRLAHSGDEEVSVHINDRILDHHTLVAGATGSGKSHLLSNLAHAATAMKRCVILFDHKPDHQNHHEVNEDAPEPRAFTLKTRETEINGATDSNTVRYWTLDPKDVNPNATLIEVQAQELDGAILAGTIFYRGGEENQAETFEHIVAVYADKENGNWTLDGLKAYIKGNNDGVISKALYGDGGGKVHSSTMNAIRRKIEAPGRIPQFLNPQAKGDAFGKRRERESVDQMFQPGLNVIRIDEENARAYALFLDQLLRQAAGLRSSAIQRRTGAETEVPKMQVIIDEASDIFTAESKHLRAAASNSLAEQIRKGRSLHIGYTVSVQSAGDVPERIRNNLNTTIVGRHRNMGVLREAVPTAKSEMLDQADKLKPGEMFVDMFGVRSLLSCKMDLSPSQLTVGD